MAECKRILKFVNICLAGLNALIIILSLALPWIIGTGTTVRVHVVTGYDLETFQYKFGLWNVCSPSSCGPVDQTGETLLSYICL